MVQNDVYFANPCCVWHKEINKNVKVLSVKFNLKEYIFQELVNSHKKESGDW